MNRHMTFVSKQCAQHWCANDTSRWMAFMFIPYEPIKSRFCTTINVKLCPPKFVMHRRGRPWVQGLKKPKEKIINFVERVINFFYNIVLSCLVGRLCPRAKEEEKGQICTCIQLWMVSLTLWTCISIHALLLRKDFACLWWISCNLIFCEPFLFSSQKSLVQSPSMGSTTSIVAFDFDALFIHTKFCGIWEFY
jgi:hypothetical protein